VTTSHDEPVFDPLGVIRRRRWSLLLPLLAGGVVGLLLVKWLPREYVSSATLAVTTPSVSGDLARAAPQDLAERIRAISQELLSPAVVERVAREEGLLEDGDPATIVEDMRAKASVSLPVKTLAAGRVEPDAFVVSYTGRTAEEAQRVTNRLLEVFIARNAQSRQARATDTAGFLGDQLRESRKRLDAVEEKLRRAKESFSGVLPEQALANLQAMSDVRQRSETNAQSLRSERDRLAAVEQELAAARREAAIEVPTDGERAALDRVAEAERQLAEAQRTYTSRHPELQRLAADVASARAALADARGQEGTGRPPKKVDASLVQLEAEQNRLRARIRDLQAIEGRNARELSDYRARVDQAPLVEQRLAPLQQAYEFEREQYVRLAERHQAALLSESLETRRAGSQFAVLYPASRPAMPSRPNVPRVIAFSLFAGALLGGLLALTREYLDKSVHDARTLQQEFDQVVLAEIPNVRRKRA
jgi:polysaccharide chain length determinant protein (PEP-CTERM system associated)